MNSPFKITEQGNMFKKKKTNQPATQIANFSKTFSVLCLHTKLRSSLSETQHDFNIKSITTA